MKKGRGHDVEGEGTSQTKKQDIQKALSHETRHETSCQGMYTQNQSNNVVISNDGSVM